MSRAAINEVLAWLQQNAQTFRETTTQRGTEMTENSDHLLNKISQLVSQAVLIDRFQIMGIIAGAIEDNGGEVTVDELSSCASSILYTLQNGLQELLAEIKTAQEQQEETPPIEPQDEGV